MNDVAMYTMVISGSQKNYRSKWLLAAALAALGASKVFAQCGVPIPDGNIVLTVPAGGRSISTINATFVTNLVQTTDSRQSFIAV